jgi:hypothetical protein
MPTRMLTSMLPIAACAQDYAACKWPENFHGATVEFKLLLLLLLLPALRQASMRPQMMCVPAVICRTMQHASGPRISLEPPNWAAQTPQLGLMQRMSSCSSQGGQCCSRRCKVGAQQLSFCKPQLWTELAVCWCNSAGAELCCVLRILLCHYCLWREAFFAACFLERLFCAANEQLQQPGWSVLQQALQGEASRTSAVPFCRLCHVVYCGFIARYVTLSAAPEKCLFLSLLSIVLHCFGVVPLLCCSRA